MCCLECDDDWNPVIEVNDAKLLKECELYAKYVCKLYGEQYMVQWMKKYKGETVLGLITMSDIAHAKTLIINSHEVWKDKLEVKMLMRTMAKTWRILKRSVRTSPM